MAAAREVRASLPPEEVAPELLDVPAAVVCVFCGEADCVGCAELEQKTASGVVLFVPWERPMGGIVSRLWSTTRATTQGADAFFAALPDGPIAPAISFALVGEGIAVLSSVVVCAGMGFAAFSLIFPGWAGVMLGSPIARATIFRAMVAAWLCFTGVLVFAHVLHGITLHLAAVRAGARGELRRAVRFGLYAVGWDVATSPFGLLAALFTGGPRAVLEARRYAFTTPGRATASMLRGLYQLPDQEAARVRFQSMSVTFSATLVAIVGAMFAIYLAT